MGRLSFYHQIFPKSKKRHKISMQINIFILSVDKISKTTAKGNGYFQLDVAYKDIGSGKVESRKIMPFGDTSTTHKVLSEAKTGDTFEIVSEKKPGSDGKEYWTWLSAKQHAPGTVPPATSPQASNFTKPAAAQGSSYPTNDERAATQRSIVRQSMVKAAVDSFSSLKTPPDTELVLKRAQEFVNFVNEKPTSVMMSLFNTPNDLEDATPE